MPDSNLRNTIGTVETAQWLRALKDLPENVPSAHTAAQTVCNSSPRESKVLFWPLLALQVHGTFICVDKYSCT